MINLPSHVQFILTTLENAGYEAYIVGGCVRDIIRGVPPKDWDITTSATPLETKALFVHTIDTGLQHGTVTVLLDGFAYEVTTYRVDGKYTDNRRPDHVAFTTDITEDLSRRDFTMNAIAYNPKSGVCDPFGGQNDIDCRLIRCVGDSALRFGEDALRMLRAIRFSAVTGFDIDTSAIDAIKELSHTIKNVSPERIREELGKLITSAHPEKIVMLEETGLSTFIYTEGDYLTVERLKACSPKETMRLALFLINVKDCEKLLQEMRFDNKTAKETALYVRLLNDKFPTTRVEIKKILRYVPQNLYENFLILKEICYEEATGEINNIRQEMRDITAKGECFMLKDLAVTGNDLIELGISPGAEVGTKLEELLNIVLRNPELNEKAKLIGLISSK